MPAPSTQNPFLLAAEQSPALFALLRSNPGLAHRQDEHGYSLLHAAASYNFIELMRALNDEYSIVPNMLDEDGETALFVVETVEAAQFLIEQVGTDPTIRNSEGKTAEESIRLDGDYVSVADYLRIVSVTTGSADQSSATAAVNGDPSTEHLPPLPPGIQLRVGSLEDEQSIGEVADPELRRRIEELASRDDFEGEDGQQQLRDLITDAVRGVGEDEREVRRRVE